MFKKILLAYDTSPHSQVALQWALELAHLFGGKIDIVTVLDSGLANHISPDDMAAMVNKTRHKVESQSKNLLNQQTASPDCIANIVIDWGKPSSHILKMSEAGYDLIIAGHRGLTGLLHVSLGSVASQIIQQSTIPVLIAKQDFPKKLNPLLMPIDFSSSSEELLLLGSQLARTFQSHIDLLHVVSMTSLYQMADLGTDLAMPGLNPKFLEETACNKLDSLCEKYSFLAQAHKHVKTGMAAHEIAQQAKLLGSKLVVMSRHGHGKLAHWLLGSTTESVARYSETSVLIFSPLKTQPS